MDFIKELKNKNNKALSKAITLVESTLEKDQKKASDLISKLKSNNNSIRIGVTGIPGVGKSTFIEKFGKQFIDQGKRVAVLAIDPSSEKTKGSILGDKSRMEILSADKNSFIRPSSNSGTLGGVTNKTKDSILLCEEAGFDIIIIETVGVGQSETTVSKLVDVMILLTITGAGDQLQAIKRGIIELAHLIVITKDDGDNKKNVKQTLVELKNIISINPPIDKNWQTRIEKCSAKEDTGIDNIYQIVNNFIINSKNHNLFISKRKKQEEFWIKRIINEEIGNRKFKKISTNNLNKIISEIISKKKSLNEALNEL